MSTEVEPLIEGFKSKPFHAQLSCSSPPPPPFQSVIEVELTTTPTQPPASIDQLRGRSTPSLIHPRSIRLDLSPDDTAAPALQPIADDVIRQPIDYVTHRAAIDDVTDGQPATVAVVVRSSSGGLPEHQVMGKSAATYAELVHLDEVDAKKKQRRCCANCCIQ